MNAKTGEVWKIKHSRKGALTVRFMNDADMSKDGFFDAEIVEGTAHFMSMDYRAAQQVNGLGTAGTIMPFRTSLTTLIERIE